MEAESISQDDLLADLAEWIIGPPAPSKDDGWFTVKDIVQATGAPSTTIASRCQRMVAAGELEKVMHRTTNYYRRATDGKDS